MKKSLAKSARVLATLIAVVFMFSIAYAAEQTITDEVALDIFSSLGDKNMWQLKCTEDTPLNFEFSGRDGQQIKINYYGRCIQCPGRVTPNGKTLTFNHKWLLCDTCPVRDSFRLEIVSRSLVRMFVKEEYGSSQYWSAGVHNYSCEVVRK